MKIETCPGPLIWHDVIGGQPEGKMFEDDGALLSCASCDYLIVAGNINDDKHMGTPDLIREEL